MAEGITRKGMIKEADRPLALLKNEEPIIEEPKKDKIGPDEIAKATEILRKYKEGKANLEEKLKRNEQFWKLRQWGNNEGRTKSTTWLWSDIQGRYSDVMDSYPTCNIRPRQFDDVDEAMKLSSILPVIFSLNKYEETYSDIAWYTLKQGGSVQGVFWDSTKNNGLGDITIKKIDLMNMFWEPGITDIQKSAYVFTTELVDNIILEQKYPQTKGHLAQNSITVGKYIYDDTVDMSEKSVVVDMYYHTEYNGKRVLQYCKFVNDVVLFASENETEAPMKEEIDLVTGAKTIVPAGESLAERGYYDHGMYPFVVMNLYPIEGSLIGYGLTDIGKDTQTDIDELSSAVTGNAREGADPRYFVRNGANINEEEYLDRNKKLVHVEGSLDDINIRPIDTKPLSGIHANVLQMRIDELKTATSNQDVHNGTTASGVTAASAIAALQEAAGKNARSTNREFYRAFKCVVEQVIELIRQFYNTPRVFRIAPDVMKKKSYATYDNSGLVPQKQMLGDIDLGLRKPEFDVSITAEKANPYKKMEMNELALQFYSNGFFNPQMADQALACLELMDFENKDAVIAKINENQTIQSRLIQFERLALTLAQKVDPSLAEQIGNMILADGGQPLPSGADVGLDVSANPTGEARTEAAREQAQESTQI